MSSSQPLAGMVDQVGGAAERFEHAVASLRAAFRRFGLEPVIPPVIERAEHFLDRSGEDLRSRLYLFTDPGGREICLRPELTIPTVRLYADRFKGDGRPLRAYYIGPVFRYDTRSEGRYRQFTQAGAELIGEQDVAMADVEAVALAIHGLRACGLDDLRVAISDISFFTSLLDPEVLPPKLLARLQSLATNPRKLGAFVDNQLTGDDTAKPSRAGGDRDDMLRSLGSLDPTLRRQLVSDLVHSLQPTEMFGSRTTEDIVTRTLELADMSGVNRLPRPVAEALRELLTVDLPLPAGLRAVADITKRVGNAAGERVQRLLAEWDRKLALLRAFGLDPDRVHLDLKVGRGIDYYSSFVFEITSGAGSGAGAEPRADADQLCAGGRYDELVQNLSGRPGVPAVGFAVGVERVLLAQGPPPADDQAIPLQPPDVLVVAGGEVAETDVVRSVTGLREQGLAAVYLPGRRVRYGLNQALKLGVRHLAIVGEWEAEEELITVRDLEHHEERSFGLAEAVAFIHGESRKSQR